MLCENRIGLDVNVYLWAPLQFSLITQSYLTHDNPMDCSTPGIPVLHHLPEFAQTHVHWVDDAIQQSHSLSRRDQFTHLLSSSFRSTYYFPREAQLSQYLQGVESNGVQLFATPWTPAHQASPSFTISQSLLKLMSIELMMPSNHLILCCPL